MPKLVSEQQLLDPEFRQQVIAEITGAENVERKREFLKRYEVYKDKTKKYVIQRLMSEGMKQETVNLMSNRAANISICRKVVNKLARTYSGGVSRDTGQEDTNDQIENIARLLCFDQKMQKSDRYRELHKNTALMIVPEPDELLEEGQQPKKKLKMKALNPWHYDVIEDPFYREIPRVYIISDFIDDVEGLARTEAEAGVHNRKPNSVFKSNNKDDIIADNPRDAGRSKKDRRFTWWSETYHFVTDGDGQIVDGPDEGLNPIERLPIVNNAEEQDGQFWAIGGDDLVDGSILINLLATDMFAIAQIQGYGQFVVTGKNLPERLSIGPHNAIMFDYDPSNEDPEPKVSVVSGNPPLESWMASVEQYVALLLTTNNLSPGNVSVNLDAKSFPSGIAMLVERSEVNDDISDKHKDYQSIERELWEITKEWLDIMAPSNELNEEWSQVGTIPDNTDISIKFSDVKPVVTEGEKLENIKKRKDLGINEQVDLIILDNPDMTREEAEEKLLRIRKESLERMASAIQNAVINEEEEDGEDSA